MIKISKVTGVKTKNYVCCDKCFHQGIKFKNDVESDIYIKHRNYIKIVDALISFYNGLLFRMPLCCNLHFTRLKLKGISLVAYVESKRRNDGQLWPPNLDHLLSEKDIEYMNTQ